MKDFNSKVIYINDEAIDKSMSLLSDFCINLNDLSTEFEKVVGYTPDLETVRFLLLSEKKDFYRFIQQYSPNNFPKDLGFSAMEPPEKTIEFVKEKYVQFRTDVESIQVAGIKLNFKKMLGLVDYPSFEDLVLILRNAMAKNYIVFGGKLKDFVDSDLSNIYENGAFSSELLKSKITASFTIKTQTQDDNDLVEILSDVNAKLNDLQKRGFKLHTNDSEDGVFRGIKYFIDFKNQTFIVSRRLLERKIATQP